MNFFSKIIFESTFDKHTKWYSKAKISTYSIIYYIFRIKNSILIVG